MSEEIVYYINRKQTLGIGKWQKCSASQWNCSLKRQYCLLMQIGIQPEFSWILQGAAITRGERGKLKNIFMRKKKQIREVRICLGSRKKKHFFINEEPWMYCIGISHQSQSCVLYLQSVIQMDKLDKFEIHFMETSRALQLEELLFCSLSRHAQRWAEFGTR